MLLRFIFRVRVARIGNLYSSCLSVILQECFLDWPVFFIAVPVSKALSHRLESASVHL